METQKIPEFQNKSVTKLKHGQHILKGDNEQKYPTRTSKTKTFDEVTVVSSLSSSFKFIKKNWENTKYDVPLLAVSYSYSRRAVAWH